MSLILEALKKSEAERRIGEAPGLLTPSATASAAQRPSRTWLWLALALLLVSALIMAWWLGRMGSPETGAAAEIAVTTATEAAPVSSTPAATTAVPSATPSSTDRLDGSSASARPATPPAAPPRQPATAPAPTLSEPPLERSPRAPGERESLPVTPGALPAPALPAITPAPATATTPSATTDQPEPVVAAPEPAAESLPRLHQLDSATRSQLPPLRISMHVFTDAPGGRFVIIDNHRYAEGASVASSLNIAEIRRDGVVMDYRGRRFLLDRPG